LIKFLIKIFFFFSMGYVFFYVPTYSLSVCSVVGDLICFIFPLHFCLLCNRGGRFFYLCI
jgi:hypothetical protein